MQGIAHFTNKNVLDIVKGSAATLALFASYVLLVFAGPLAGIFAPFPVLYYTLKNDRGVGVAIVVVATLALLPFGPTAALLYVVQCGLLPLLTAEYLRRGMGAAKSIAYTLVILYPSIVAIALLYGMMQGVDINALVMKGINDAVVQTGEYYRQIGLEGEDLEILQSGLKQVAVFLGNTYPAILLVCIGAIAGINVLVLKKTAWRIKRQLELGDFSSFRNPDKLVWILILSGFALLAGIEPLYRIALNVIVVAAALYFVQGMSIASFFFRKYQVHRFTKFIFYFLLILQPYLAGAVAAAGLFDLWCDFRTPKKKENL